MRIKILKDHESTDKNSKRKNYKKQYKMEIFNGSLNSMEKPWIKLKILNLY